jgi:NADH:ubiquinone oxidoreductase subunit 2 (subunit N)
VIKLMYFDAPPAAYPPPPHSTGARIALGINAAVVLVLGLPPMPMLDLCGWLSR